MKKAITLKDEEGNSIYPCPYYPVGAIYESVTSANPSNLFGGTWSLVTKEIIDTGWQNFSWTNSTYIGTTQSSYTQNKWRVKDNILYVQIGAGATASINTGAEHEIARIPIKNNASYNTTYKRVWIGAVGGGGAQAGFMILQNATYLSIYIKPHVSTNDYVAPWYSSHLTIPLDEDFLFTTGSYDTRYIWKRTK